jgi:NAD(P)-dependent dehydrogenase (short-subunit alcohol dehydrogenase family)
MRLNGKTAVVTGGAQGLGLAISKRLAGEGARVFICDINETEGARIQRSITDTLHKEVTFIKLDVKSEEDWKNVYSEVLKRADGLDILVNNAGINIRKTIEEMETAELDEMLAVNVRGPFIGIKHAIPLMRRRGGGCIVNISSVCGLVGHKYTNEAYTTTKGALTLLTKSVAVRYAKDNIRCNSVHPSTVETPLVQSLFKDPERKKERLDEVPLGRLASAEDVAEAVVFLVSPESAFINGAALPVDGGLTAY